MFLTGCADSPIEIPVQVVARHRYQLRPSAAVLRSPGNRGLVNRTRVICRDNDEQSFTLELKSVPSGVSVDILDGPSPCEKVIELCASSETELSEGLHRAEFQANRDGIVESLPLELLIYRRKGEIQN